MARERCKEGGKKVFLLESVSKVKKGREESKKHKRGQPKYQGRIRHFGEKKKRSPIHSREESLWPVQKRGEKKKGQTQVFLTA